VGESDNNTEDNFAINNRSEKSIEYQFLSFISSLISQEQIYSITNNGFVEHKNILTKAFEELKSSKLKKISDENGAHFLVRSDAINEITLLLEEIKITGISHTSFSQNLIVSLISSLEFLITNSLKWAYFIRPELLNNSGKSFTFKEVAETGSLDKFKDLVIEKEIDEFSRKSFLEQFNEIEKKHKLDLIKKIKCWKLFLEISARRNLFVHSSGIVNEQYLDFCTNNGIDVGKITMGDRLTIDNLYFHNSLGIILEIGLIFSQEIWRHFKPEEIATADGTLVNVGFNFLNSGKYRLAEIVFSYGCKLSKVSSDEIQKMLVINLAQAHKWIGNEARCNEILDSVDWSAVSNKFKLAYHVLKENYSEVYKIMKLLRNDDEEISEIDYRTWPLFKKVKQEKEFQDVFSEIYKIDLNIIEESSIEASEEDLKQTDLNKEFLAEC